MKKKRWKIRGIAAVGILAAAAAAGCGSVYQEAWPGESWLQQWKPSGGWAEEILSWFWPGIREDDQTAEEEEVRAELESALQAMISPGGDGEAYIWNVDLLDGMGQKGDGGQAESGGESAEDSALSQVRSRVKFEIGEVTEDQAEIHITSPDVVKIIEYCVASGEVQDGSQIPEMVKEAMEQEFPTRDFTVQAEIKRQNGHAYLVSNRELSNALSGGLYEAFGEMITEYIEEVEKQ